MGWRVRAGGQVQRQRVRGVNVGGVLQVDTPGTAEGREGPPERRPVWRARAPG